LRVTTVGIGLGAAAALALGRVLEPLLFNTRATNPAIYGLIALTLAVVSVVASALPAWRAARVDPNVALRAE
jgi:ABC-type antimicrobial peptide transport system permease subunit